jgi:hypothetical protein
MKDISETEAAVLMLDMKLQIMEIGLKSLSKIIDECAASLDDVEKAVKEIYGSDN